MFSGLTSQVNSWIGKKQENEVPAPDEKTEIKEASNNAVEGDSEIKKDAARKDKLEMLGNIGSSVKSQMSSWLGGGLTGSSTAGTTASAGASPPADSKPTSPQKEPSVDNDDDASSATGGADSEAQLSDNSPTEETEATQIGNVSAKAVAGAKSFGSLIYSGFSKASKTVTEAGAKIKKTVEETSILGELNKEQEAFIKEKQNKGAGGATVPPWVGRPNEEILKKECLSLSEDRRNFVRAPPPGVDFEFDFEQIYPVAMATLAADPKLEKMRFDLVPKVINEENFWRNYFYRLSLICQANEVSSMASDGGRYQSSTESTGNIGEEEWEKELEAELDNYEMVSNDPTDKNLEVQLDKMLDSSDVDDLK